MDANGGNQAQCTDYFLYPTVDRSPHWSPDGTAIVFQSNRGNADPNDYDVYVTSDDQCSMSFPRPPLMSLAALHPDREEDPAWSPDGTKIVYVHSTATGAGMDHQLFTMNSDGTGQALLPPPTGSPNETNPSWSPDGLRIAFSGTFPGLQVQVYVLNADGTGGLTQLTTPTNFNGSSPRSRPMAAKSFSRRRAMATSKST